MTTLSITFLLDALREHHLLDSGQLQELQSLQSRFPEPKALAKELIQRSWITPYQANQLFQGKGQDLVLGSYILMERLGEGGMGQVFKARHRNLGRIAAIKLIRKERLQNPDAVRRFQREVRAAAALSHPNIVRADDADEIAGTCLMVMEYIEGAIDLARLVKKNGPLPISQACDYIRQAALGLQHAYERGMVHRDIKPANLLLASNGKTIKILDMGLARLDQPATEAESTSCLTREDALMGTPDYIAPEQAMSSHMVDIRADLYSLGCTLYFLLSGQVPFPEGSLMEKLMKHQVQQPEPIERRRPEVPPGVARIVRKLMAKQPEDRYQSPAELADALTPWCNPGSEGVLIAQPVEFAVQEAPPVVIASEASRDTVISAASSVENSKARAVPEALARLERNARARQWLLIGLVTGSFLLLVMGVLLFFVIRFVFAHIAPPPEEPRPVVPAPVTKKTANPPSVAPAAKTTSTPAPVKKQPIDPTGGIFKVDDQLTKSDPLDWVRGSSFHKVYMVKMTAKQSYVIDMVSKQFDSYLRLENADGKQLASDDDSGGNLNARIVFTAPRDDIYRVITTTFAKGATGNYTLTIRALKANK